MKEDTLVLVVMDALRKQAEKAIDIRPVCSPLHDLCHRFLHGLNSCLGFPQWTLFQDTK